MLETIREFALEQLDAAGETEGVRRQHATFFCDLAERADSQFRGPGQLGWLQRLEAEHDNFRAALGWSVARTGDGALAGRLAVSLLWFWYLCGHVPEMGDWLTRALECWVGSDRALLRARLLARRALAVAQQGDYGTARDLVEESLSICRELGATQEGAFALFGLGQIALATGDPTTAEARFEESLAAHRESRNAWGPCMPLMALGRIALGRGDLETGRARLEESLAIVRQEQDTVGLAQILNTLGDVARRQGDYGRASALYEEGLTHFRLLGTRGAMAGLVHNLGYVSLHQQDATRAAELFVESLSLFRHTGDRRGLAECLAGLAAVAAVREQPAHAARLFGASEALLEVIGARLSPSNLDDYDRYLAIARTALDVLAFTEAWSAGRAMSPEQAIADALEPYVPT